MPPRRRRFLLPVAEFLGERRGIIVWRAHLPRQIWTESFGSCHCPDLVLSFGSQKRIEVNGLATVSVFVFLFFSLDRNALI